VKAARVSAAVQALAAFTGAAACIPGCGPGGAEKVRIRIWYQDRIDIRLVLDRQIGRFMAPWTEYLVAASVMVTIPVVIIFLSLSRWLVSGLTLGSVKG
jgi:hypothetical protein